MLQSTLEDIKMLTTAVKDLNDRIEIRVRKILIGDDQTDFLEFIVAVLYRLAHSDHIYHVDEDLAIRDVAKIFGITKTHWQFTKETIVKFFRYRFLNRKQNA